MPEEVKSDEVRRLLSKLPKAELRDLRMRTDIRRIARMKLTIRRLARRRAFRCSGSMWGPEPVSEIEVVRHYGIAEIEACRLLDAMVREREIAPSARKAPTWLEERQQRPRLTTLPSPASATHVSPFVAAQWRATPADLEAASFEELRARLRYNESFKSAFREVRTAAAAGEIELCIPGRGIVPREDCWGYRSKETGKWYDPLLDREAVIEVMQVRNRWPGRPKAIDHVPETEFTPKAAASNSDMTIFGSSITVPVEPQETAASLEVRDDCPILEQNRTRKPSQVKRQQPVQTRRKAIRVLVLRGGYRPCQGTNQNVEQEAFCYLVSRFVAEGKASVAGNVVDFLPYANSTESRTKAQIWKQGDGYTIETLKRDLREMKEEDPQFAEVLESPGNGRSKKSSVMTDLRAYLDLCA